MNGEPLTKPTESGANPEGVGDTGLVSAEDLLKVLWPIETSRPTVKWVRSMQERRLVPFKKIGRLVFFDASEVRAAFDRNFSVKANGQ